MATATSGTQQLSKGNRWGTMSGQSRLSAILIYLALTALALVFLFPLFYLVSRSLMSPGEINTLPPKVLPETPQWSNYSVAWNRAPFWRFLFNSSVIVGLQLIGTVSSAALCGYGFARLRFPGRNVLFILVLATLMLPSTVTLIPLYIIFANVGWLNTFLPLTVPAFFGGGAFNIFLFRQFFMTLPVELDEAAIIDGANRWQIFTRIIMPLSVSPVVVVSTLTFLAGWTDLFGPLIFLVTPEKWTLAQGLNNIFQGFYGQPQVQYVAALSLLLIIPPLALYAFVQRYLLEGIALTGVK